MKIHIVLDTNVIVSALISKNPQAATVQLLSHVLEDGQVTILVNERIKAEYLEVLHRDKFHLNTTLVDSLLTDLFAISYPVEGKPFKEKIPDEKDTMFIEVSLAVPDSKIVTGNIRHFPGIMNAMTPAEFLNFLDADK